MTFATLKPGDHVVVRGKYEARVATVTRVTRTQIAVENTKFRAVDGRIIGGDRWSDLSLSLAPEQFSKARSQAAERDLRRSYLFTQAGVIQMRAAADAAEAALREAGKWEDPQP